MTPQDRDTLIDALLDGDIAESDFLRLEAELHVDPAARKAYYQRQKLHMLLQTEAASLGALASPPAIQAHTPERRLSSRTSNILALAALFVALLSLTALFWPSAKAPEVAAISEPTASGFGVVSSQVDAVWGNPLSDGALVPPGRVRLASGAAQLELFSGVNVVVEGEAEFELLSAMEMTVHRGKVRARVPEPAQGFRIHTPKGDVVDLGTEFGVSVADDAAEVHVIDGEVEWHSGDAPKKRMTEGQGIRQSGSEIQSPAANPAFLGIDELTERRLQSQNTRLQHAIAARRELSRDPRVLIHYTVDSESTGDRRLPNRAGETPSGAIVAASPSTDRFGRARHALDFSPTGSRVRLQVPGEHGSLTFLAWLKINSLDRLYNSLFLTDGHDLGEPHWQILNDGRLFFSVKRFESGTKNHPDKRIYHSPSIWKPELSGQWIMLATVHDLGRNEVVHYLNGEVLSRETIPDEYRVETVRIGAASIGNWSEPAYRKDPEFAVRNLNGSMDEFALFDAALSETEIAAIFASGKP